MKKIEAIIPPFKLTDVKEALEGIGIRDFTATEMREFAAGVGYHQLYRGAEVCVEFRCAIKIEAVCPASAAEAVKSAVIKAAYTGRRYDRVLVVCNIERVFVL